MDADGNLLVDDADDNDDEASQTGEESAAVSRVTGQSVSLNQSISQLISRIQAGDLTLTSLTR
jgi:hypothetical protein